MKVWNVKYCLTSGITHIEVTGSLEDKYVYTIPDKGYYMIQLKVGRDAFARFDYAFTAAEKMRLKKIDALKRKIAELERMNFRRPGKI
jgi:hypothetical protein